MEYKKVCPKCLCKNPQVNSGFFGLHWISECKNIIKTKKILFFNINTYCNSTNEFDDESYWKYIPLINKKK